MTDAATSGHPIMEFSESGRRIKIYANGVIEGCEAESIVNHIGNAIHPRLWAYFSKFESRPLWQEEYREFTEADYRKWATEDAGTTPSNKLVSELRIYSGLSKHSSVIETRASRF